MRFLQTEWHKHERDRNRWEIERAEMKARIAKLEGENRAEKRLHEVHLARIKILERALKKERAERPMGEGKSAGDMMKDETAHSEKEKARGMSISWRAVSDRSLTISFRSGSGGNAQTPRRNFVGTQS